MQKNSRTMVRDLTEGSVTKLLLSFAMPLFVSNALQALYNLVDMVVVGQVVGGAGMSAVSIGGDILHILTFLAMGFSAAGQVIIAQHVGAGRMDEVRKLIGTMFSFLLAASVVMSAVCYILREPMLNVLNTPAESRASTMDYTVTCILGLPFIYGYNIVSAILRGMGDSKRPFLFVAIAAVINTALDLWFVAGLRMGAFGAALATVIGQAVSFAISIVYLYIRRESFGFDFRLKSFAVDRASLKSLVSLGVPMAIQSAAINISKIVLTAWINSAGLVYSALNGIYAKVGMMAGVVSNSFTTAGSSMVGQCLGAGKFDRVPKVMRTVLLIGLALTVPASAVVLLWNRPIFSLFTSDAAVLAEAAILIVPTVINLFGCCTRSVAFSIINGSGNSKMNLAVALIDGMISRIGIAALLGFACNMGCKGFWYGDSLAGFMPITLGMIFYLSGRWRTGDMLKKHLEK